MKHFILFRTSFSLQNFAKQTASVLMKYQVFLGCSFMNYIMTDFFFFSFSLLCFSWTGVCSNHHYNCGYNCYGGSDHLLVEPLQTLNTLFHQPAEPEQKTGRNSADGEYERTLPPNPFSSCCTRLHPSLQRSSDSATLWKTSNLVSVLLRVSSVAALGFVSGKKWEWKFKTDCLWVFLDPLCPT